jgi:hypothetical protein
MTRIGSTRVGFDLNQIFTFSLNKNQTSVHEKATRYRERLQL